MGIFLDNADDWGWSNAYSLSCDFCLGKLQQHGQIGWNRGITRYDPCALTDLARQGGWRVTFPHKGASGQWTCPACQERAKIKSSST